MKVSSLLQRLTVTAPYGGYNRWVAEHDNDLYRVGVLGKHPEGRAIGAVVVTIDYLSQIRRHNRIFTNPDESIVRQVKQVGRRGCGVRDVSVERYDVVERGYVLIPPDRRRGV